MGSGNVRVESVSARMDETINLIRDIKKRAYNVLTRQRLSLAEDYIKGRLELTIEFQLMQCCAGDVVDCDEHIVLRLKVCHPKRLRDAAKPHIKSIYTEARNRWDEQFVLVEDVEIVEGPQGILPAVVGFQILNGTKCVGRGPLHIRWTPSFPSPRRYAVTGFYELLKIFARREISVLVAPGSDRRDCQGNRYVIQCGPQIVNHITNDGRESVGSIMPFKKLALELPRLRIYTGQEFDLLSDGHIANGRLQLREMTFGPFSL